MTVERGAGQHRQNEREQRAQRNWSCGQELVVKLGTRYAATKEKGERNRGERGKAREKGKEKSKEKSKEKKVKGKKTTEKTPKRDRGKGLNKDKRGKSRKSKKGRRGESKDGGRGFAVWRAVTLFPRPSLKMTLSVFIYFCCVCYAGALAYQAHSQLEVKLNAQGLKRTFYARTPVAIPLPKGEPLMIGQLIDQRKISLWQELKIRSKFDLKSEPPLITHPDPQVNKGAWYNALKDRKVDFIESQGVGDAGEPSLLWPPLPAPQPTLIVGHAFDKIAWVHPERGVVLSEVPPSWKRSTSFRLPPETSRRW